MALSSHVFMVLLMPMIQGYLLYQNKSECYKNLANYISKVAEYHRARGDEVAIRCGDELVTKDLANLLIRKLHPNLVVLDTPNNTFNQPIANLPLQQVVFMLLDRIESVFEMEAIRELDVPWNSRLDYRIVICSEIENVYLIEDAIKTVWRLRIRNFFMAYYVENKLEVVQYNPFVDEITKVDGIGGFTKKHINMYGYPLKVCLFHYPPRIIKRKGRFQGVDVRVLRGLIEYLNATLVIDKPHPDYSDHFTGMFQVVYQNISDFGFVSSFYSLEAITDRTVYTYPTKMDDVVILMPKPRQIPQYKYIFLTFGIDLWVTILACMFVVACFDSLLLDRKIPLKDSILSSFSPLLGQSFSRLIYGGPSVKSLFITWLYVCIVLGVAFQSTLTGMMVTPKYEKELDTLHELREHKVDIVVNVFHSNNVPESSYPKRHLVPGEDNVVMHRLLKKDTSSSYALQISLAEELIGKSSGPEVFHMVREHLVPGLSSYHFPTKSPYLDEVNTYLLYEEQFRLSQFEYNKSDIGDTAAKRSGGSGNISLSMSHLQGAFYILIIGNCCGILVFLVEVLNRKRPKINAD